MRTWVNIWFMPPRLNLPLSNESSCTSVYVITLWERDRGKIFTSKIELDSAILQKIHHLSVASKSAGVFGAQKKNPIPIKTDTRHGRASAPLLCKTATEEGSCLELIEPGQASLCMCVRSAFRTSVGRETEQETPWEKFISFGLPGKLLVVLFREEPSNLHWTSVLISIEVQKTSTSQWTSGCVTVTSKM